MKTSDICPECKGTGKVPIDELIDDICELCGGTGALEVDRSKKVSKRVYTTKIDPVEPKDETGTQEHI